VVRRAPYTTVQALAAWTEHRYGYLRGRLLLAGVRIETLDFTELIAAAESALFEPTLHGGATSIDEVLDKWEEAIAEIFVDEETFGESKGAQAGLKAAEEMFPQAEPLPAPEGERTI